MGADVLCVINVEGLAAVLYVLSSYKIRVYQQPRQSVAGSKQSSYEHYFGVKRW